jgi:hypothetical protein
MDAHKPSAIQSTNAGTTKTHAEDISRTRQGCCSSASTSSNEDEYLPRCSLRLQALNDGMDEVSYMKKGTDEMLPLGPTTPAQNAGAEGGGTGDDEAAAHCVTQCTVARFAGPHTDIRSRTARAGSKKVQVVYPY